MENVDQFIEHVKAECKANNIKLKLKQSDYVVATKSIKCSGYFDETNRELVVAKKNPQWLEILVHEYGHLTQWKENCREWRNLGDSIDKLDDWLQGKEVKNIKTAIARVRNLELDNEKRAVKIMKNWNLPIDTKVYTQKANAYVAFYNWMYFTRRWCSPKNSPVRNPEVYEKMPKIFRMDYQNLSKKYVKIFEKAGI